MTTTTKLRRRATRRPLRLKRPRVSGTLSASATRQVAVRALTAAPRTTPTIELNTAFADTSLEMDESGQKFRVGLGLQNAVAANDAALDAHLGAGGVAHALATVDAHGFMSKEDKALLVGFTPPAAEWPPNSGHLDNEEWSGTPNALPAGWGFWGLNGMLIYQGGVLTAGTGGPPQYGNIDPFTYVPDPGGTNIAAHRLDINSKRPSYCYWQPMGGIVGSVPEAGRWALMKKFTQPVGTDAFFLMHYVEATQFMGATYAASDGGINFMLCGDDANRPTLASCIMFSFRRKMGTAGPAWRVSGPNGTNEVILWMLNSGQAADPYLVPGYGFLGIEKRGSFWRFYIFDERGNARFASASTFYQSYAFTPVWWGINVNSSQSSFAQMYAGCNFLRRWDTKFPFI